MKHKHLRYIASELSEYRIDQELRLQELFLVYGTVEESLELQVPEEVALELPGKEVIFEVLREVGYYLLEREGMARV